MNITPNSTFTAPSPSSNNFNVTGTIITLGLIAIGAIVLYSVIKNVENEKFIQGKARQNE